MSQNNVELVLLARMELGLLRAAKGLVDDEWLEDKAIEVLDRGLGELPDEGCSYWCPLATMDED